MNTEHLFQQNYAKLQEKQPETALFLLGAAKEKYPFIQKGSYLNLLKTNSSNSYLLYDNQDPSLEAKEWFQSINMDQTYLLYVYGIGLGYYYNAVKHGCKNGPTTI